MTENTICWAQFDTRAWSPCQVVRDRMLLFLKPEERPVRDADDEVLVRFFGDGLLAFVDPENLLDFDATFIRHVAKGKEKGRVDLAWKAACQYMGIDKEEASIVNDFEKRLLESQKKSKDLDLQMRDILKQLNIKSHEKEFGPLNDKSEDVGNSIDVENNNGEESETKSVRRTRRTSRKNLIAASDNEEENADEHPDANADTTKDMIEDDSQKPNSIRRSGRNKEAVNSRSKDISSSSSESENEDERWSRTPRRSVRKVKQVQYKDPDSSATEEDEEQEQVPNYPKAVPRRSNRNKMSSTPCSQNESPAISESDDVNVDYSTRIRRRSLPKRTKTMSTPRKENDTALTSESEDGKVERPILTTPRRIRQKRSILGIHPNSSSLQCEIEKRSRTPRPRRNCTLLTPKRFSTLRATVTNSEHSEPSLRRSSRNQKKTTVGGKDVMYRPITNLRRRMEQNAEQSVRTLRRSSRIGKGTVAKVDESAPMLVPNSEEFAQQDAELSERTPRRSPRNERRILTEDGEVIPARTVDSQRKTQRSSEGKTDDLRKDASSLKLTELRSEQSSPRLRKNARVEHVDTTVKKENKISEQTPVVSKPVADDSRLTLRSNSRRIMPRMRTASFARAKESYLRRGQNDCLSSDQTNSRIHSKRINATPRRKILFDDEQDMCNSQKSSDNSEEKTLIEAEMKEPILLRLRSNRIKRHRENDDEERKESEGMIQTPRRSERVRDRSSGFRKEKAQPAQSKIHETILKSSTDFAKLSKRQRLMCNDILLFEASLKKNSCPSTGGHVKERNTLEVAKRVIAPSNSQNTESERAKRFRNRQSRGEESEGTVTQSISKAGSKECKRSSRHHQRSIRNEQIPEQSMVTPLASGRHMKTPVKSGNWNRAMTTRSTSRTTRSAQNGSMQSEQEERLFMGTTRHRISRFVEEEDYISESELVRMQSLQSEDKRLSARLQERN